MAERGDTKARIYDCALALFSKDGYAATSMSAIAEAVGVRKATLYSHVSGKEELFAALFAQLIEEHAAFVARVTAPDGMPLREKLLFILRAYIDYNRQSDRMAFWDQCFYSPPEPFRTYVYRQTEESSQDFASRLAGLVAHAALRGEIAPLDPAHVAQTFYYLMMGFAMSRDMDGVDLSLEPCFDVFWRGVEKSAGN